MESGRVSTSTDSLELPREKKTKFSRILEAEITYLQMEFENWGESEPDEPDDCPTDSQLTEHDAEVDEWDKAVRACYLCVDAFAILSHHVFLSVPTVACQGCQIVYF
jgi:hypothetical protein